MTLQALSESNRRLWLEAMDGKEPVRNPACFAWKPASCSCLFYFSPKSDKSKHYTQLLAPSSGGPWSF